MLSNAYFLAKFRFDTAENEPAKNLQICKISIKFANFADPNPRKTCAGAVRGEVSGSWKSCAALSPARNGSIPAGESPDAAAAAEPARGASKDTIE